MPTGFIYVVTSVGKDFKQPSLQAVPTWFGDRLYFGPCKRAMRPRMRPGDFVFGISPSLGSRKPRRVLFGAKIAERMTFEAAYHQYPFLRGPEGPIHVTPHGIPGTRFPYSRYEHIPGANHPGDWPSDLATPDRDAFFVCDAATECTGRWLGASGPLVEGDILGFLRNCQVWGSVGFLSASNQDATSMTPVRYRKLFTGLHLETNDPIRFISLICQCQASAGEEKPHVPTSPATGNFPRKARRTC